MDRNDSIYGVKCTIRLLAIAFKMLKAFCLQRLSLKITEMYTKWHKAFINKPKLSSIIFKRSCVWTLRTAHWQDRFFELEPQATKMHEEIVKLKSFYDI